MLTDVAREWTDTYPFFMFCIFAYTLMSEEKIGWLLESIAGFIRESNHYSTKAF